MEAPRRNRSLRHLVQAAWAKRMHGRQLVCLFQTSAGTTACSGRVTYMRSATKAAFSPSHNATPVQINIAMMRPPVIIGRAYALIWQEWRSPDEYGAQHEYC